MKNSFGALKSNNERRPYCFSNKPTRTVLVHWVFRNPGCRRQDEFQKTLTYLQDCYTRELEVAWAQVTNEANEALRREAEKNALSWEDRTRELEQQRALKWEQREALLVRDKDSDLLVARRLHEEVLYRVQKDAERVLEVCRRDDGILSSLREELRTL
ncbi:hypothetical protein B5M09_012903 [Aphanomyces astaci]|uniref:Uncharacterized protein n=1 Tax=Aphanomyces astaci TaxID=112090 RepID=A0A3R7WEY7_APHAT|nr:hypothetical protein B5M09_012903 [Aphanomyces astaci]